MNEPQKTDEREKKSNELDAIEDLANEHPDDSTGAKPGFTERLRKLFAGFQRRGPVTKHDLAKDRTRSLVLLIVGVVGAGLLFIGLVSTPTAPPSREAAPHGTPNLGRRGASADATGPHTSVTPLLNADVQSDSNGDQLSPSDIQATSRAAAAQTSQNPDDQVEVRSSRDPLPPTRNFDRVKPLRNVASDPLSVYRPNTRIGGATYSYGSPARLRRQLTRRAQSAMGPLKQHLLIPGPILRVR